MLCFQLLMAPLLGQILGREDRGPGLFGELFGRGLHGSFGAVVTVWVLFLPELRGTDPLCSVCTPACGQPIRIGRVLWSMQRSRWKGTPWTPVWSRNWCPDSGSSTELRLPTWRECAGRLCMSITMVLCPLSTTSGRSMRICIWQC